MQKISGALIIHTATGFFGMALPTGWAMLNLSLYKPVLSNPNLTLNRLPALQICYYEKANHLLKQI